MKSAGGFAAGWGLGRPSKRPIRPSSRLINLGGRRKAWGQSPLDDFILIKHRIVLQMQAVTLNGAFSPLH